MYNFVSSFLLRTNRNILCSAVAQARRQNYGTNDKKNIFHRYKKVMDVPAGVFKGFSDRFNGITVHSSEEANEDVDFETKLKDSLSYWVENNRRAVWFKVFLEQSEWIPHLTKNGFTFHHAKENFVLMTKWLPTHEEPNIPVYSHTMVGVGGAVLNDKNEVLVVRERCPVIPNSWKLPGGHVEPGEKLIDAAIREVCEETGIETEFETIISMRHSHGGSFECSDLYVVIGLKAKSLDIVRCEREIEVAEWMPVAEYVKHPNVHETNRHFVQTFLKYREEGIKIDCEERTHQKLKKLYNLYFVKKEK